MPAAGEKDPYSPPQSPIDGSDDAPRRNVRLERGIAGGIAAVVTLVVAISAGAFVLGSSPTRTNWGFMVKVIVPAAIATAVACSILPIRRRKVIVLAAIPLSIIAFQLIGWALFVLRVL